jgi:hypothetical protein
VRPESAIANIRISAPVSRSVIGQDSIAAVLRRRNVSRTRQAKRTVGCSAQNTAAGHTFVTECETLGVIGPIHFAPE